MGQYFRYMIHEIITSSVLIDLIDLDIYKIGTSFKPFLLRVHPLGVLFKLNYLDNFFAVGERFDGSVVGHTIVVLLPGSGEVLDRRLETRNNITCNKDSDTCILKIYINCFVICFD